MRKIPFYGLLLLVVLIASCKKSEKQKAIVTFNFQLNATGSPLPFFQAYNSGNDTLVSIELLWFYLSDISFVNQKGKEILASEIELVKLDETGKGSVDVKVPAGDYQKVKFGIGVKQELNESDPSKFSEAEHPLSTTQNTYWGMNSMYRFVMIDGRYDTNADNVMDGTFSYHTGYKECYRESEFAADLTYEKQGTYSLNFTIQADLFFHTSANSINVVTESNYHGSLTDLELAARMSDNFKASIQLNP